jgi:hypothetical protein
MWPRKRLARDLAVQISAGETIRAQHRFDWDKAKRWHARNRAILAQAFTTAAALEDYEQSSSGAADTLDEYVPPMGPRDALPMPDEIRDRDRARDPRYRLHRRRLDGLRNIASLLDVYDSPSGVDSSEIPSGSQDPEPAAVAHVRTLRAATRLRLRRPRWALRSNNPATGNSIDLRG